MEKRQDIFEVLHTDHEKVSTLINQLERQSIEKREGVLDELENELEIHSAAEEEVLYPRLKQHDATRELAAEAIDEHYEIRESLDNLRSVLEDGQKEEWGEAVEDLRECVEHHVEEEEGEIFRQMREVFTEADLQEIKTEFAAAKQQLKRDAAA